MDIWALCRSDHGLTWEEFLGVTLAQLEALEERRAIKIRHARHDAAFVVSAILNTNLPSGTEPFTPFDFLPGFEQDPEVVETRKRRKKVIASIRSTFAKLPPGTTPAKVQELRASIVARLEAQGYKDAAEMMTEAYPNL